MVQRRNEESDASSLSAIEPRFARWKAHLDAAYRTSDKTSGSLEARTKKKRLVVGMHRLARFADARNTAEGKFVAILLSVLLVFSFLNVTMFTDRANAGENDLESSETTLPVEDKALEADDAEEETEAETEEVETEGLTDEGDDESDESDGASLADEGEEIGRAHV